MSKRKAASGMGQTLEVIACGEVVSIGGEGDEPIKAIVTGVLVRGDLVQYEVVWWNGRARSCEWVNACEVVSADATPAKRAIGFVRT